MVAALFTNLKRERLREKRDRSGRGRLIRMAGSWGLRQSSSKSIKVFANYKKRSKPEISGENINKDTKKKIAMMMSRCSNQSNANANANAKGDRISNNIRKNNVIDDDLVASEILVRLPVKTLMRFKSVCKRWRSSIQHDPHFHQLHFKHSETRRQLRCLAMPYPYETVTGRYRVSNADEKDLISRPDYHTFEKWDDLLTVNGLVCARSYSRGAVCIFNPSTRQETQWIKMTEPIVGARILFGYDPVTNKHKVLCHQSKSAMSHEVLTVGENSWRKIGHDHQVPRNNLCGPCVYVNGAIYWMEKISIENGQMKPDSGGAQVLVAFDVGSEKFRVIPIPDFIINQPRDESYWQRCRRTYTDDLLEVNGRVALLRRMNKNTVSMWILEGDHDHNRNWNEVVINLPFNWVKKGAIVHFKNVPWTDQIIVKPYNCLVDFAYSYNWKNNTSKKLPFNGGIYYGNPSEDLDEVSLPTRALFVESLFSVM